MKAYHCCQLQPQAGDHAPRPASWWRHGGEVAKWLLPGIALALLPKCPVCVVAYVALGTGLVMAPASANLLLRAVTAICVGALTFCLLRRMLKHLRRIHSVNLQPTSTTR